MGLIHNTTLQELSVPIPLPIDEYISTLFDVISQKNNLTELGLCFITDKQKLCCNDGPVSLTCLQVLPLITTLLQANTGIKVVWIVCHYSNEVTASFLDELIIEPNVSNFFCLFTLILHWSMFGLKLIMPDFPKIYFHNYFKWMICMDKCLNSI